METEQNDDDEMIFNDDNDISKDVGNKTAKQRETVTR